jgi:dipeptidyl aminopeptidase/acylaminoacyl peptidase
MLRRLARRALALALVLPSLALAQSPRKPLTQDTYDLWRTILQPTLSADGRWAVYTLTPTVGDGMLIARATSGATEHRVPRGSTGRPLQAVTGQPFSAQAASVTGDSKHVVFLQYPTQGALDSARARRARPAEQPKNGLAILALESGRVTAIEQVRGFQVARDGGRFVVYQVEADSAANGGAAARGGRGAGASATAPAANADSARPAARRKDSGAAMVIRELASGTEVRVEGVTNYALHKSERWLAYSVTGADSLGVDGVYVRDLSTGTVTTLKKGTGNYRSLAFDDAGTQVAFISDTEMWGQDSVRFALYHASLGTARARAPQTATRVVSQGDVAAGMQIAERARVEFVKSGGVVQVGVSRVQPDSIPADSLADKAVVDLWHWQDPRPQPMQRLQAAQDRGRQYTAVYHVATKQFRQIANERLPQVTLSEDGRTAVATTSVPYEARIPMGEDGNDIHVINTVTGVSRQIATNVQSNGQLSPNAKYVAWWHDGQWQLHDIAANRTRELTAGITGVSFARETHDTPSPPQAWGIAGWTRDDAQVLVYDRYDIWEIDPTGVRAARNLTDGAGRRENLTFRIADLDPDERFIDPSQPLLLRTFNNASKESGLYRDRVADATTTPERIVMAPKSWPVLQKARNAEQYLLTRADHREYPNLWTGSSFTQLARISDAMPEQAEYRWGNVELVKWLNSDGVPMEGLLYTPEGFDRTKQYPMLTYFYEQLSDGLHNYTRPAGRNTINPIVYTSLGYLVFMPNIHYTLGYPGPSSVKSIVPGVQSLIAQGFVDPKRIGISGQSWGGYQTAYIITQTNLFAAAVPNATVVNMTSAYGGIRWESGVERAIVNYEQGQSRIGGSLWEYPERYIENSPLFYLDRVQTPVLFMANDADGAVPWYQGIEYFVAMRRLGKEAYMLNYNGDAHNPRKYANQKDIDRRMQEFFAHHLLGAPKPEWMQRGIPFIERGRDQLSR